jgi:hypothetical protein
MPATVISRHGYIDTSVRNDRKNQLYTDHYSQIFARKNPFTFGLYLLQWSYVESLIYHKILYNLHTNSTFPTMLNQFTDEYKKIMLDAENRAKQFGHKEILPEDILIQIAKIPSGNIYDLFSSFGINDAIIIDVLARPPFYSQEIPRTGDYVGISPRLKNLIVISMKIAASFSKTQAGIEDFLLALFRVESENWFVQLLDFVGITPKEFESQAIDINKLIA